MNRWTGPPEMGPMAKLGACTRARRAATVAYFCFAMTLVLDLVVCRLGDDRLIDQLVLPLVRPTVDDLFGVGVANPRWSKKAAFSGERVALQIAQPHRRQSRD